MAGWQPWSAQSIRQVHGHGFKPRAQASKSRQDPPQRRQTASGRGPGLLSEAMVEAELETSIPRGGAEGGARWRWAPAVGRAVQVVGEAVSTLGATHLPSSALSILLSLHRRGASGCCSRRRRRPPPRPGPTLPQAGVGPHLLPLGGPGCAGGSCRAFHKPLLVRGAVGLL